MLSRVTSPKVMPSSHWQLTSNDWMILAGYKEQGPLSQGRTTLRGYTSFWAPLRIRWGFCECVIVQFLPMTKPAFISLPLLLLLITLPNDLSAHRSPSQGLFPGESKTGAFIKEEGIAWVLKPQRANSNPSFPSIITCELVSEVLTLSELLIL